MTLACLQAQNNAYFEHNAILNLEEEICLKIQIIIFLSFVIYKFLYKIKTS